MTKQTSWRGKLTRELRDEGMRGGYARYHDRRSRTGLEVVKNRKYYNDVYTPSGKFIGREIKYHNYSSNDESAKETYRNIINKKLTKKQRKNIIR